MRRTALGRRALLRGILAGGASVTVGLPLLETMLNSHGTALADGTPLPVRLVTWFFGNGVNRARWIPGGMFNPVTGPDYPLSEQLMPLEPVARYVSAINGFQSRCQKRITHHEGMTLFNGYTFDDNVYGDEEKHGYYSNSGGPTIDQVAAKAIGHLTKVSCLQVGVSKRESKADFGTTMHALSHVALDYASGSPTANSPDGPKAAPLPAMRNPVDVFVKLFGSDLPEGPEVNRVRTNVLDAVREQALRLDKRLGSNDRARMEAHLDGIRDLERRIGDLEPTCETPVAPTETNKSENGVEPLASVNRVMTELIAYAFRCDLTRIVSFMFNEGASGTVFPDAGFAGHHENSHNFYIDLNGKEHDRGGLEGFNNGVLFIMQQLGFFLNHLMSTEDGPGQNLLDNSAILIGSDCLDGWSHDLPVPNVEIGNDAYTLHELPQYPTHNQACLVAGRAGGRLVHPGIHLVQQGRNLSDVTLTVLKAVVPEIESIGREGDLAASSTVVDELTANESI